MPFDSPDDIRFSFVCRAFNCAEFIEASIRSVYDEAYEIIIVENAIDWFAQRYMSNGESTDGTHEIIQSLVNNDWANKIKYHGPMRFRTKDDLNQYCVNALDKDSVSSGKCVYWILDADEAYTASGLAAMRRAVFENPQCIVFNTVPMHFAGDPFHIVVGPNSPLDIEKWDNDAVEFTRISPCSWDYLHTRVVVWKPFYSYARGHATPVNGVASGATGLHIYNPSYSVRSGLGMVVGECIRYHFGYGFKDQHAQRVKTEFYRWRDGLFPIPDVADKEATLSMGDGGCLPNGARIRDYNGPWPEPIKERIDAGGFSNALWTM